MATVPSAGHHYELIQTAIVLRPVQNSREAYHQEVTLDRQAFLSRSFPLEAKFAAKLETHVINRRHLKPGVLFS